MLIDYKSMLIGSEILGAFAFWPLDSSRRADFENALFYKFQKSLPSRNLKENAAIIARELSEELLAKTENHDFYIYRLDDINYVIYSVKKALSESDMSLIIENLENVNIKPPCNKTFEEFLFAISLKKVKKFKNG